MSTETVPAKLDHEVGEGLFHGAHYECQVGQPIVKMICGLETSIEDQKEWDGVVPLCIVCNSDPCYCPLCGTLLQVPNRY